MPSDRTSDRSSTAPPSALDIYDSPVGKGPAWIQDNCLDVMAMIEINITHLCGLRMECDVTEDITQSDIRILENKLVKLFSKLVYGRKSAQWRDAEELKQFQLLPKWLKAIGLDDRCQDILMKHYENIDEIMNADDEELRVVFLRGFNFTINDMKALEEEELAKKKAEKSGTKLPKETGCEEELAKKKDKSKTKCQKETCCEEGLAKMKKSEKSEIKLQKEKSCEEGLAKKKKRESSETKSQKERNCGCKSSQVETCKVISATNDETTVKSDNTGKTKQDISGDSAAIDCKVIEVESVDDKPTDKSIESENQTYSDSTDIRIVVRDYVTRLLKAQQCLHQCVNALQVGEELPEEELYWDSWDHWLSKADASKRAMIAAAIAERQKAARNVPKPLPPLPELKTARLMNFRTNGDSSKSTGSSPLSPPAPPLSAGLSSHRSNLSASSSSSSIIPSSFYNNLNFIVDPNHAPPFSRRPTPPPTPPVSQHKRSFMISSSFMFSNSRNTERKFPTTPPPIRRHHTNIFNSENFPLTKSKSHEEHLSHRIEPLDPVVASKLLKKYNLPGWSGKSKSSNKHNSLDNLPHVPHHHRRRLATEPGSIGSTSPILTSSNCSSPVAISPENQNHSDKQSNNDCFIDIVPRSPLSSSGMLHSIHHRFTNTLKMNSLCNVCEKQMFFGYKCRDCKYYCHRDCLEKAPNSCGLPNEYFNFFRQTLTRQEEAAHNRSSSPMVTHKSSVPAMPMRAKSQLANYPTSTSNPSSPAMFPQHHSASSSVAISPTTFKASSQFPFPPDISITGIVSDDTGIGSSTMTDDDSQKTSISTIHEEEETGKSLDTVSIKSASRMSCSCSLTTVTSDSSTESTRTVTGRLDSQDSQASEMGHDDERLGRQNSVTSREWDIPWHELVIEDEIGTGRFGTVFKGKWHGEVAIKCLNMSHNAHLDQKITIDRFKQEVAVWRRTRHDNLVLFMGACMKPPHLALVTSLCKGLTLHTHIHVRHDKLNINRAIGIAQQICLGMGYLHARGIVHKDLKTKNIFLENGRVIISDFGLSSVKKLCVSKRRGDWLSLPKGWLTYLAPEIIRHLTIDFEETDALEFSSKSDIFAFGTVWFELVFGMWPFPGQPTDVIIWQVGRGVMSPLHQNFDKVNEEIRGCKDLLLATWAYLPENRPDFSKILELIDRVPRKRLQRSPSHPIHLQFSDQQGCI